jgi:hypothetical protein
MRKTTGFVLLMAGLSAGSARAQIVAPEFGVGPVPKWEYRVLGKDQLPKAQAKDLADALNKLGDEGWELVAAGDTYIFKRPKSQDRAEGMRRQVAFLQAEVDKFKDRVAWSKRMARKGFLSDNQLQFEEDLLKEVETALDKAKAEVKALPRQPEEAKRGK